MNELSECLADLRDGAFACLNNANRLLEDAQVLLEKKSYLSCFLLSQLSLEELAKGFKIIEKHLKGQVFLREEWENLTFHRKSHVEKLKYLQKVEAEWTEECCRGTTLSYIENLQKIVSKVKWARNIDEYWEKIAEAYHRSKLDSLYVGYDFEKKQWIEPLNHPIFDGIFIDDRFCLPSMKRAENLSQVLMAKLRIENEIGSKP